METRDTKDSDYDELSNKQLDEIIEQKKAENEAMKKILEGLKKLEKVNKGKKGKK